MSEGDKFLSYTVVAAVDFSLYFAFVLVWVIKEITTYLFQQSDVFFNSRSIDAGRVKFHCVGTFSILCSIFDIKSR